MTPPIAPPAAIGVVGGGQLGRYFVLEAREMGYETWVLEPDESSPAGRLADRHLVAAYDDLEALDEMGAACAAITTEFENVPAAVLDRLAGLTVVHPSSGAVSVCQDRIAEKTFLRDNGIAHARFAVIESEADLAAVPPSLFPGIVKSARLGYDGKGQVPVDSPDALRAACDAVGGVAAVLEKRMTLDVELSVVLARGEDGTVRSFPPSENAHAGGILDVSVVPARVEPGLADAAVELATRVAAVLGYVGTLGVELFVCDGALLVNEIAPRPHNSGHYTLDACTTSQFEQQVRALCGLPLADVGAHSAAVMVNLLGDLWFDDGGREREPDWAALLAIPGLRLHLYGKTEARPGRKMGHVTVVADDRVVAIAGATAARAVLGLAGTVDSPG